MVYDVLITGAGITGAMTAYKLARYNIRIAVVEARNDVAMGTTKANSAIVHAGYDAKSFTKKAECNVKGAAQIPEIAKILDVKYKNIGSLVVAFDDEELNMLDTLFSRGIQNGVKNMEIISKEKLRELEPNISKEAKGALYAKSAGIVCPYELCIAVSENAKINGCDFYFDSEIVKIEKKDGIFVLHDKNGNEYKSKYLVNAAGLFADNIAKLAGENDFPVKIIPRKGEYMMLDKTNFGVVNHTLFAVPTAKGKGILVTPTVDGNIMLGPNACVSESKTDTSTTNAGMAEVQSGAKRLVPDINLRSVITEFSGVRATPDTDDFFIEASKTVEGLIHLAGIESPGLVSSPAIADCAVSLLKDCGLVLSEKENYIPTRPKRIRVAELSEDERNELIKKNPAYGKIVCRCESITEGEIIDACNRPIKATSIDAVKRRTRAGMGRCQGGFCSPSVWKIISRETGIPPEEVTKKGGKSYYILTDKNDSENIKK